MNLILLGTVMLILGVSAKFADLINDNGLKQPFRGASILLGFIWGFAGIALIIISPLGGLTYVAHVLYWFLRGKLDFLNHALGGTMLLLGGYYFRGNFFEIHRNELLAVFSAYAGTGYVHTYIKAKYPKLRPFLRLRFRIYLIPFFYTLYTWNIEPIMATVFGMIGAETITYIYRDYKEVIEAEGIVNLSQAEQN